MLDAATSSRSDRCAYIAVLFILLVAPYAAAQQPGFGQARPAQPPFGQPGLGGGLPAGTPSPQGQAPTWLSNPLSSDVARESTARSIFEQQRGQPIVDVKIVGNETVKADTIFSYLRTRRDRQFDPEIVQSDKRRLASSGLFRDVRIFVKQAPGGVSVTFQVFERPTIRYVEFLGNRGLSDKALKKESGLEVGDALNFFSVEEARRKVEDLYHRKGFPKALVTIREGNEPEHRGAVFNVSEGPLQRISKVEFIGNTIVSDQVLKTHIESKPGILWYLIRGKVDRGKIEEDVDRITSYYRDLGYFRARVGRQMEFDDDQEWLKLKFVIDEGPRYTIRSVTVVGSERFDAPSLEQMVEIQPGQYFNLDDMNRDLNVLRDLYHRHGHVYADINADPRFLDEGSELDLVYSITEGQQFRVGKINVHIAGEYPHTRESVVRDRLSIRPGDIINVTEVRASERRLKASQLFENDPASGKTPRIVIRPPSLNQASGMTANRGGNAIRGQSPDKPRARVVDLDVYVWPSNESGQK